MQIYVKIWTQYGLNMPKNMKNMEKYALKYAQYAEIHILHICIPHFADVADSEIVSQFVIVAQAF